jgi:hypothetical protein
MNDKQDIIQRARAYLDKVPGAVQGQVGDVQTLIAACKVTRGFALRLDVALGLLRDWNQKCSPPWREKDLKAKVDHALKYGKELIGGMLQTQPGNGNHNPIKLAQPTVNASKEPSQKIET